MIDIIKLQSQKQLDNHYLYLSIYIVVTIFLVYYKNIQNQGVRKNMSSTSDYGLLGSDMLEELYELYNSQGDFIVLAFYRTINNLKVYYDFQLHNQPIINGSYDKIEIIELIFHLENA